MQPCGVEPDPGASPAAGGFARGTVDSLNGRSGAGNRLLGRRSHLPDRSSPSGWTDRRGRAPVVPGAVRVLGMALRRYHARLGCGGGVPPATRADRAPNVTTISSSAVPITPSPTSWCRPSPRARRLQMPPTWGVSGGRCSSASRSRAEHGKLGAEQCRDLSSAATVTYNPASRTATLTPWLASAKTPTVAVSGSVKDMAGTRSHGPGGPSHDRSESYAPPRTLLFAPGTYTGYRFNSAGW